MEQVTNAGMKPLHQARAANSIKHAERRGALALQAHYHQLIIRAEPNLELITVSTLRASA